MKKAFALLFVLSSIGRVHAAALTCDLTHYRREKGIEAAVQGDALIVQWSGERGESLRVAFAIEQGTPIIRELALKNARGPRIALGRNLRPEFGVTTGLRRSGHGLPQENRWDVY